MIFFSFLLSYFLLLLFFFFFSFLFVLVALTVSTDSDAFTFERFVLVAATCCSLSVEVKNQSEMG